MRILFIAPRAMGTTNPNRQLTTFHETDLRILRELGHDVTVLPWHGHPYGRLVRSIVRQDLVFCWTIGDHSALGLALAKARHIPFLCVIGGYEFANLPELEYGNLATTRGYILSSFVYSGADALLYVDPSLMHEAHAAFGQRTLFETESSGEFNTNEVYVPTGYDTEYWSSDGRDREDLVVTVCHAPGWNRYILKGVDRFVNMAEFFPDYEFHIAGEVPPDAMCGAPRNVSFDGWLERDAVRDLYRRAKVYCQLSMHEGLPNALCEAILCGCVPVGTPVNGIPTAIGDAGCIADDFPGISAGIGIAALSSSAMRERARNRIVSLFPLSRRRDELRAVLERFA